MTWKPFVVDQKQELFIRLTNYFNNLDTKMTRDKYLDMCEQLNKEPKSEEIPVDFTDLGETTQLAINIFNSLGDRTFPEIGYTGKDYTNLPVLIEVYGLENKELLLEVLTWLDARAIKKSSDHMKKEYDKLKRKSSGR